MIDTVCTFDNHQIVVEIDHTQLSNLHPENPAEGFSLVRLIDYRNRRTTEYPTVAEAIAAALATSELAQG